MAVENSNLEAIFAKRQGFLPIYLFNIMGGKGDGGSNWIMKDMTSFMRPPLMSWVTGKESFYDSVRNSGGAAEQAVNRWVMGEPNKTTVSYGSNSGGAGFLGDMMARTQSMQNDAAKAAQETDDAWFDASQAQISSKEEEDMIGQDKAYFDQKKSLADQRLKQLQGLKKNTTSIQETQTKASPFASPVGITSSTNLLNVQKPLMNVDALSMAKTFDENQALNTLMPPSGSNVKFGGN